MFKQQITIKYQYVNDLYICMYIYIYIDTTTTSHFEHGESRWCPFDSVLLVG